MQVNKNSNVEEKNFLINADEVPTDTNEILRKAQYLAMLDKSLKEIEEGKFVEVTAEQMRKILNE